MSGYFFWGGIHLPACSSHYTSLPTERGFCFNLGIPQFPPSRGQWPPSRTSLVGRREGGAREQRPLCALAPGAALYELQALPSLQPSSGQSHSLGGGRHCCPPPPWQCLCVAGSGDRQGGRMGKDAGDHPAPLGGCHPSNGASRGVSN